MAWDVKATEFLVAGIKQIQLEDLTLRFVRSIGSAAVVSALHANSLKRLTMDHTNIGDSGATAVAAAMNQLPLEPLSHCDSHIGNDDAGAIVSALPHCLTLRSLKLSGNEGIEDPPAFRLRDQTTTHALPDLIKLSLFKSGLSGAGMAAVGSAVAHFPNFKKLRIGGQPIAGTAFADAVAECESIEELELRIDDSTNTTVVRDKEWRNLEHSTF